MGGGRALDIGPGFAFLTWLPEIYWYYCELIKTLVASCALYSFSVATVTGQHLLRDSVQVLCLKDRNKTQRW